MKGYKFYTVILLLTLLAACDDYKADNVKFDNAVYLNVSKTDQLQPATFNNIKTVIDKPLQAVLAYPSDRDVAVTIACDPSLVSAYNARYGTSWSILDPKYYTLSTDNITIPAGKTVSEVVTLRLQNLIGEGDQHVGELPIDATFLLPITITNASMSVLAGSATAYYVIKRSSAITTAAQLTHNWITFPSLNIYSNNSKVFNGLRAVTYEALIYIDEYASSAGDMPANISSIMGVEQYLLFRLGDTNFERTQLQFDGSGGGSTFGKIPMRDAKKLINKGEWVHVACTYNQATRTVCIYVNGKIQSKAEGVGITAPDDKNKINLAMRSLFNLWETSQDSKEYYESLGYNTLSTAYQFYIGYSYNEYRPLNGKIAEARVWSVARTPEQIWNNMYDIESPKDDPSLLGYWKFNDGSGNIVKDYSLYGNDGVSNSKLVWPDGIEIPKINTGENQ